MLALINDSLLWATAITALIAAGFWWRSAIVVVRAPKDSGVGALLDGGLVGIDARGRKFDMHKTLQAQAWWSRWAAVAAGVSAVLSAASSWLKV